jgi:hypothetical protein
METPVISPETVGAVPSPNPHVLSRQLVGLLMWVGLPSLLLGFITCSVCLSVALLTFADAWKCGIYKRSDKRGFLNISPMAWGIAMAFLFIVTFPAYLLHRTELRTIQGTNRFYWGLVVVGAVLVIALVGNIILWM